MDSGRPVPITIRSKLEGSMGGYDVGSSIAIGLGTGPLLRRTGGREDNGQIDWLVRGSVLPCSTDRGPIIEWLRYSSNNPHQVAPLARALTTAREEGSGLKSFDSWDRARTPGHVVALEWRNPNSPLEDMWRTTRHLQDSCEDMSDSDSQNASGWDYDSSVKIGSFSVSSYNSVIHEVETFSGEPTQGSQSYSAHQDNHLTASLGEPET
nr:hypothetical protein Iba_chr02aCG4830 [Ipomoea batatas]